MNVEEVLVRGASELGFQLTPQQVDLFHEYLKKIKSWNEKINITRINDEREIVINHFLDSITPLPFISENSKVLDIGSGGGFPGIPIKIVRPSLEVILLDSVQKKVFFMRDVIRSLPLKGIKAIRGRAEDISNGIPRSYFDFVISRAVGKVDEILKLAKPYLEEGGKIILMKGKKGLEEWEVRKDASTRNFSLVNSKMFSLPFSRHHRVILIIAPNL